MKKNLQIGVLFFALALIGCSKEDSTTSPNNGTTQNPTTPMEQEPSGDENYLNLKSDYIFDQTKLHTFELTLSQSNLSFLDNDPTEEEYVEGSLSFEGETISRVGIRYKGSIGAYVGCLSGSDFTNPSGRKTCTKLSMKVKINWLDSDDKFYKLKKLQFHSQNLDQSQMRDRLGYQLFRDMGVPAPRCVHARLIINGTYVGLFALVEQIDGRFTRQNYDDGKGNLYKEVWPLNDRGNKNSDATYFGALKTNEDEDPSLEMIKSFADELSVSNDSNIQEIIEKWMNIDEAISLAVVDRVIRNDDGPFHWYCGGSSCSPHNFYWYEEPTKRTMHLIPWDLDNAFENIIFDRNPVTPIADGWGEVTNDCQPFSYGTFQLRQKSAACDILTSGWAMYDDLYEQKKSAFINGPFSKEQVDQYIDTWSTQIRDATMEASQLHSDAVTVEGWEGAVNGLLSGLDVARNK